MMASIPNMRSTPLPAPAGKANPGGDAASVGFTVERPAPPVPGQPTTAAAPVQSAIPAELLEGLVPDVAAPDGDAGDGDGTAPAKPEKAATDDGQVETAILVPFIQPVPVAPTPKAESAITGAEPVGLPCGTIGSGKKAALVPDDVDVPAQETDAPDPETATDAVVKALLQRKPPSAKQAKAEITETKADAAPAKAQPQQAQTPAAPLPVADVPQPTLAPAAVQPAPVAADKTATIEGTSTRDLAVERKLDVTRDGAWLDRLARDIARSASDDSPLRFRLHPQTLGSLHVELQQGDRGTAVRLTVETEAARQLLTDAQPRLTAEARAQGVRIAETHVDLSGSGRQAPGDQRRQDEARQTPLIRTVPGTDANGSARASARARLDRYA